MVSVATDEEAYWGVTGKVIAGRYRLEEPLGRGGMASVWEAEDVELGRRVAVKLLALGADRERFEREARAAASLAHPNVARVFDFGESDEGLYMVLELLSGGTLAERVAAGRPLPDAETERIAAGVAAGLAHAHERSLIHRDLKPDNILFDAEDRPRVSDFGIARLAGAGTITEAGTVLGSAATIAPEQAEGGRATPASDVYAFGAILFLMLTGRLPFEDDDPISLASMHVTEAPPTVSQLRSDAPPRLARLAAAALAKDPAERPQDGAALLAELGSAAALAATGRAGRAGGARSERRRLGIVGAAAAVAALAVTGGLVALALSDDPTAPAAGTTEPGRAATASSTGDAAVSLQATDAPSTSAQGTAAETTPPAATTSPATTADPTTTEAPPVPTTEPPVTETEPLPTTEPPPTVTIPTTTVP